MEIFIARQPIFNAHKRLFAYELLYRGTKSVGLSETDGNKATASVLSAAFLIEGIEKISDSRPCFVNFTRDLLLKNIPASFPKTKVVVEVLEDVPATPDVVEVCRNLKNDGYTIALDDFVYEKSLEPLIEIADIIKFDFRLTPVDTLHKTLHKLSRYDLKYLAEKVETYDEFEQANKLGFAYFQGYFFCKPEKIRIKEVASAKINLVNLLAEVNKKTTTVSRLEKIILNDVALTYKLLRYINSSYFYRLNKIESVAHAITYLGEKDIRRFVILVLVSEIATDKPGELVRLALVRAKFCELLAQQSNPAFESELFLLGLFSLLDAMLDATMEFIGNRLPLGEHLEKALIFREGIYAPYLQAVISYEKRDERGCLAALQEIGMEPDGVSSMYLEAIKFAGSVLDA